MTLDAVAAALKRLIVRGKERGRVTVGELNAALPPGQVSPEMVEDTVAMLNDIGIHVVEGGDPEDGEALDAGPRRPLGSLPLQPGAEAALGSVDDPRADPAVRSR